MSMYYIKFSVIFNSFVIRHNILLELTALHVHNVLYPTVISWSVNLSIYESLFGAEQILLFHKGQTYFFYLVYDSESNFLADQYI